MDPDLRDNDDAVLLARWIDRRDEQVFEEIYRRHACLVRSVGCRVGSPDPDELTQSVFLLLANRPEAVGDASRLSGWLIGVARKMAANQRRGMRRDLRLDDLAEIVHETRSQPGNAWSEILPHLGRALEQLSSGRRDAVIQVYLEGRSQAEAAQNLGCSLPAIRVRLSEGLHLLRDQLSRRGVVYSRAVPLGIIVNQGMAKASGTTIGGKFAGLWTLKTWWSGLGIGGKIVLTGAGTVAVGVGCVTVVASTMPQPRINDPIPEEPVAELPANNIQTLNSAEESDPLVSRGATTTSTMPGTAMASRVVLHPGKATLGHDGDPWVWKGHSGVWIVKPGQFRATADGGSTQEWWHWNN